MNCPNPVKAPRASSVHSLNRRFLCSHYDRCLNCAVFNGWENFSCGDCNAFAPHSWSKARWAEDRDRCLALVGAIFCPDLYAAAVSF